jgi:hypothetical protein
MEQKETRRYGTPIRVYSKKELASMYFPGVSEATATRHLMRWIRKREDLYRELQELGYKERDHLFTGKQVECIFYYLSEP